MWWVVCIYIAIGCNCIFIINRLDQSLIYIYTYPLPYYKTKMYVFHLKIRIKFYVFSLKDETIHSANGIYIYNTHIK